VLVGDPLHVAAKLIIATDADSHMLDRALQGRYPPSSLKDLPDEPRSSGFTRTGDEYTINSEFRPGIHWLQQDVRSNMPAGQFHLILCRNLAFSYFDERLQADLLRAIVARLCPGGVLVTGKQERLPDCPVEIAPLSTDMYRGCE